MIFKWQVFLAALVGLVRKKERSTFDYMAAEIKVLRQQLDAALDGRRLLLTDKQRRLLAIKGKALGLQGLREYASIFTPETILRWHRELVARKYDGSAKRKYGRPRIDCEIEELILTMAKDNKTWGYRRIQGALKNLGYVIAHNTVRRVLRDHGIEPAPDRGKSMSWAEFLRIHRDVISAADLFTIEAWTPVGLVRYFVLFVIDHATRAVEIAGISSQPNGDWMKQIARNLTDCFDGFLLGKRYLILDRDPLYTEAFRAIIKTNGTKVLRIPPKSPDLNSIAERFVGSIRRECLDRVIVFGEDHLWRVITNFAEHYNAERNHQAIGNNLIRRPEVMPTSGPIERKTRLGGLLSYYFRPPAFAPG